TLILGRMDGTVMEQRGRNGWQTFGSPKRGKWLDLARTVATGCHRLRFRSHGKEGVDGSSPSEGSRRAFVLPLRLHLAQRARVGTELEQLRKRSRSPPFRSGTSRG